MNLGFAKGLCIFNPFIPNAPFLFGFLMFQGVGKGCIGNQWVNLDELNTIRLRDIEVYRVTYYMAIELQIFLPVFNFRKLT